MKLKDVARKTNSNLTLFTVIPVNDAKLNQDISKHKLLINVNTYQVYELNSFF